MTSTSLPCRAAGIGGVNFLPRGLVAASRSPRIRVGLAAELQLQAVRRNGVQQNPFWHCGDRPDSRRFPQGIQLQGQGHVADQTGGIDREQDLVHPLHNNPVFEYEFAGVAERSSRALEAGQIAGDEVSKRPIGSDFHLEALAVGRLGAAVSIALRFASGDLLVTTASSKAVCT